MNDPDHTLMWRNGRDGELSERLFLPDDFTTVEEPSAEDLSVRFTNLAFIKAALKRRVWLWCATALVGLLIGCGLYIKFPPAYHATVVVVLTNSPNEDPLTAMETDATLSQSLEVAESVVHQLGLKQTVGSFIAASAVSVLTDQVLTITVGAPSGNAAVVRANALAAAFLQFRTTYIETQQQELVTELNQQINQARQLVNSVNGQISQVSAEPSSHAQRAKLRSLQTQSVDAINALAQIKQYVTGTLATTKTTMDSMVRDSKVLNSATLAPHSRKKSVLLDVAGGLVGGLGLGMGIVVIGSLMSERLRRRDEVAEALDAPVRLSVGALRARRWLPALPWRATKRNLDMRRVVAYLHRSVPGSSRGPATLAVVAVDDARVAAQAVTSLAASYASDGKQVVVADLSGGTHLARLLGAKDPGIHAVSSKGAHLLVTVPRRDDVAPVGPLPGGTSLAITAKPDEVLVVACSSADIVLTLATLDPAFGSDYLATWAADAVAIVTAGRSSEGRIRGVGELIRLAGTRLDSVVLVGADKSDQSLGVRRTPDESMYFGPV